MDISCAILVHKTARVEHYFLWQLALTRREHFAKHGELLGPCAVPCCRDIRFFDDFENITVSLAVEWSNMNYSWWSHRLYTSYNKSKGCAECVAWPSDTSGRWYWIFHYPIWFFSKNKNRKTVIWMTKRTSTETKLQPEWFHNIPNVT